MPKLEVEILPNGEVHVHVVGVSGPSCVPLARAFEQSLGTVTDLTKTADFYKQPVATQTTERRERTHG